MSTENGAEVAKDLLDAGIAASQANESARALDLFEQASQALQGWALPHFLMGSEYAALGQWDKAEDGLAKAVLLAPDLHLARYQLGLLQFSSGRVAIALVTWEPLTSHPHDQSLALFVQGFAALTRDAIDEAEEKFTRGLSDAAVNPAVAGDIRKILEKLRTPAAQPGQPTHPGQDAYASVSQAHVLVGNYDRQKLH